MVATCSVIGCKSRFKKSMEDIRFHSFPQEPKRRMQWINRISRLDRNGKPWKPSQHSRVCSIHFRPEDFKANREQKRLRNNAVPSVFPTYPAHKQPSYQPPRKPPARRVFVKVPPKSKRRVNPRLLLKMVMRDHCYTVYAPDLDAQLNYHRKVLEKLQAVLEEKNKLIQDLQEELRRMEGEGNSGSGDDSGSDSEDDGDGSGDGCGSGSDGDGGGEGCSSILLGNTKEKMNTGSDGTSSGVSVSSRMSIHLEEKMRKSRGRGGDSGTTIHSGTREEVRRTDEVEGVSLINNAGMEDNEVTDSKDVEEVRAAEEEDGLLSFWGQHQLVGLGHSDDCNYGGHIGHVDTTSNVSCNPAGDDSDLNGYHHQPPQEETEDTLCLSMECYDEASEEAMEVLSK